MQKPLLKYFLSFFLIFIIANSVAFAQNSFLKKFDLIQKHDNIELRWVIYGGNTCNGIKIYRSLDSVNYTFIGEILGVCGSTNSDESYSFIDADPEINQVNYYKLSFGGIADDAVAKIDVIFTNYQPYLVLQNPAVDELQILIENPSHQKIMYELYSMNASFITSDVTYGSRIKIGRNKLKSGMYIFQLYLPDRTVQSGQFIIQ